MPDKTLSLKEDKEWSFKDIAVPADRNIANTHDEKVDRYQELALGVKRINQASKLAYPWLLVRWETISKDARTWQDITGSAQLSTRLEQRMLSKTTCF